MASMPGHVTRTITFAAMDAEWSQRPAKYRKDYGRDAEEIDQLLEQAVKDRVIDADVAQHVTKHWLDQYWPDAEARAVLQRGLYWAMTVSLFRDGDEKKERDKPLPISCIWICSGSGYGKPRARFEVNVVESCHQVTVLFLTPPPKVSTDPDSKDFQPVWSTRHEDFPPEDGEELFDGPWHHAITVRPLEHRAI